jgi:hypothetical protein
MKITRTDAREVKNTMGKCSRMRLSQNFSFGKATLDLRGKNGLLAAFSKALPKTNRVLGKARTILVIPALLLFSCAPKEDALEEAPIITSATYQHTQYNGRGQAVEVAAVKDDVPPFIITYFKSEEDLEQNRNGSVEPPLEVGDYYARLERPAGNGYRQGKNIKIEYHIQKAFLSIIADPVQRAAWDGGPKEIAAHTEPPQEPPLIISYAAANPAAAALASPPTERGRYQVTVVFPGNDRYMGASKEVELRIE